MHKPSATKTSAEALMEAVRDAFREVWNTYPRMTAAKIEVLMTIYDRPSITINQLSREMELPPTDCLRLISPLCDWTARGKPGAGLVSIAPASGERSGLMCFLTAEGTDLIKRLLGSFLVHSDRNMKRLSIDLPVSVHTGLKVACIRDEVTMSATVTRLIEDWVQRHEAAHQAASPGVVE